MPDHEIKIPDKDAIGREYWKKHTSGQGVEYGDIDAQSRLQDAECDRILDMEISDTWRIDMKLFDKLKNYVVNKVIAIAKDPKVWKKVALAGIDKVIESLDTPEKQAKFAKWLDEKLNLPFLDDDEEKDIFPEFVEWFVAKIKAIREWVAALEI